MLPLLLACVAAWRPDAPRRFDLEIPDGWHIRRNQSWFGNDQLILDQPEARASITIELVRSDPRADALPLDLLAETRALSMGRALGIESGRTRMDQIELDGREAWAVTGRRRWQFVEADYSTVVARAGRHVVVVTLMAPVGKLDGALTGWALVLGTLRFPRAPVAPDAPIFDPADSAWP